MGCNYCCWEEGDSYRWINDKFDCGCCRMPWRR
jgi:hypothetical protein